MADVGVSVAGMSRAETTRNSLVRRNRGAALALAMSLIAIRAYADGAAADLLSVCNDALKYNPQYNAAQAEYRAALQLEPLAEGKLFPQLTAEVGDDQVHESVNGDYYGVRNIDRHDTFNRYFYGVRLSQALFRGDLFSSATQAEAKVKQARLVMDAAQGDLLVGVAEAYFSLLAAKDRLQFATAKASALLQQLNQIRGRTAAGLATDADLAAAQASQALAAANRLQAENGVEVAAAQLEMLAGRAYPQIKLLPADVTLLAPQPADEKAWVAKAAEQNRGVLAQRAAVEVARLENEKAHRLAWPAIDVVGVAYGLNNGGGITGKRDETDQRIGLLLTLPIYSGGQLSAGMAQSAELQNRAESLLSAAKSKATLDTRLAYLNSTAGLQKVAALKRAVDAAVASEETARGGYDSGIRTNADVLAAVEQRYQAEGEHSAARYKFLVDSLRLRQASGSLSTADLSQINRLLRAAGS